MIQAPRRELRQVHARSTAPVNGPTTNCAAVYNGVPKYYGTYVSEDGSTICKKNVWLCATYNDNNFEDLLWRTRNKLKRWLAATIKAYEKQYKAYLVKRREWETVTVAFARKYATFPPPPGGSTTAGNEAVD